MGTMLATFHAAGQPSDPGADAMQPVARLTGAKTERVTTSGTSAATTLAAAQGASNRKTDGGFVTISAVGANLFCVAGTAPTAAYPAAGANSNGFPVMSGQSITFALKVGEKVAAIEFA